MVTGLADGTVCPGKRKPAGTDSGGLLTADEMRARAATLAVSYPTPARMHAREGSM